MVTIWTDRSRWEEKHGDVCLLWIDQRKSKIAKNRKFEKTYRLNAQSFNRAFHDMTQLPSVDGCERYRLQGWKYIYVNHLCKSLFSNSFFFFGFVRSAKSLSMVFGTSQILPWHPSSITFLFQTDLISAEWRFDLNTAHTSAYLFGPTKQTVPTDAFVRDFARVYLQKNRVFF